MVDRSLLAITLIAATLGCAGGRGPDGVDPGSARSGGPSPESSNRPDREGLDRPAALATDTLRGVIAVVGAEPLTRAVIRPRGGGPEVALEGAPTAGLRRLAGAEVRVEGRSDPAARNFHVRRFAVRAVDGMPAVDGRLVAEGGELFLVTEDGSKVRVIRPPAALRGLVGARVWIAPPDAEPAAFGVIDGA